VAALRDSHERDPTAGSRRPIEHLGGAVTVSTKRLHRPAEPVLSVVRELHRRNRVLCAVALANLGLAVVFTALMQLDGRMLLGRNVWTKPWKFATSIALFVATMGWILPSLDLSDRAEALATYVIGGAMTIEITLISLQAARGVASHFNNSTPLDTAIYSLMGITITVSTFAVTYVLWRFVRDPPDRHPAYLWGLGLGMLLFVLASFEGWLMVAQGSHAVGAPNDGPGLPLLNWSLTGGDFRVAHFIGLHALQALPLTGYYATRLDGESARRSLAVVGVVGALYSLLVGGTFLLALRGTPLFGTAPVPSVPTSLLAALLLTVTLCGTALLAVSWQRRRGATTLDGSPS
jgi:hypothetical protein